jgi:hypothetical protein
MLYSGQARPLQSRSITLMKLANTYYWTCLGCYWQVPFTANPSHAIDRFSAHDCANHDEPKSAPLESVIAPNR